MFTFKDIAEKVGSESIVSRAFNNGELVLDSTRELTVSREVGDGPSREVSSLAGQRKEAIGIIMNSISKINCEPVINGIQFANKAGYSLIFSDAYQGPEFEKLLEKIDGLIILNANTKEKQRMRQLIDREIPLVFVESYLSEAKANCIRVNNVEGGYMATRHLTGLGHTRIVHITGDLNYQEILLDRMEGYQKALRESNVTPRPELIITGNYSSQDGYQAMKCLLERRIDFTAVFAASDAIAFGVLQAVSEAGLSVPDDLSVVGFDDIEFSKNTDPPLTTVRQPRLEMGERAMAILTAIFQNHCAMNEGMKICFIPELITRGTTNYLSNTSVSPIAVGG
jgi:LacI family transcriptional regulator